MRNKRRRERGGFALRCAVGCTFYNLLTWHYVTSKLNIARERQEDNINTHLGEKCFRVPALD